MRDAHNTATTYYETALADYARSRHEAAPLTSTGWDSTIARLRVELNISQFAILEAPTGCGKTMVAIPSLMREYGRVHVLEPRRRLRDDVAARLGLAEESNAALMQSMLEMQEQSMETSPVIFAIIAMETSPTTGHKQLQGFVNIAGLKWLTIKKTSRLLRHQTLMTVVYGHGGTRRSLY